MSFGFGIGDFITVTQVAWSTYVALRDASEDFDGFASEVHSLYSALMCLRDEARSPSSILQFAATQKIAGLKDVMGNCEISLLGLQKQAKAVCLLPSRDKRQFWDKFRLAFKDKQGPRDRIAIHTASINMFLSSLTHNSLGRLEILLQQALQSAPGAISMASDLPRGPGKGSENAWNQIGQDLSREGISEKHFVEFAGEIKAYMRYLVHGGNFLSHANFRPDRPSLGIPQRRERVHAQLRIYEEKEHSIPDHKTSPERRLRSDEVESIDIDELVHSFDELFPVDEHDLPAEPSFEEPYGTTRLDVPKPSRSKAGSGRSSPSTLSGKTTKRPPSRNQQPSIENDEQIKLIEDEKRAKAIEEARARLIRYERKKEEAERAGNRTRAADLKDNAIRDIRQRLDNLNTTARRTSCDACHGPIVERYSHCPVCEGGTYDLCSSCVESGVKCKGNHRLEKQE